MSSNPANDKSETHGRDARATKGVEITRFKGLGEISPKEFQQFIGKEMKSKCWRTAIVWNTALPAFIRSHAIRSPLRLWGRAEVVQ